MEEECPPALCDGDNGGGLKRPWDLVEHAQHVPPAPDHGHGKRFCLSDSFDYSNGHTQLPSLSITSPLPSNSAWRKPAFGEQACETKDPSWATNFSGDFCTNLPSFYSTSNHYLQTECYDSLPSDNCNTSEEPWTGNKPSGTLEGSSDYLATGSVVVESMKENYLHYIENPQPSMSHINLLVFDFQDLSNMGIQSTTRLNEYSPGLGFHDSSEITKDSTALLQEIGLWNVGLGLDSTKCGGHDWAENETSTTQFFQSQQAESFYKNSLATSDKRSPVPSENDEYRGSQDFSMILDVSPMQSSPTESLHSRHLETHFKEVEADDGLAGNIDSCQPGTPRTQESHVESVVDESEDDSDARYDTCFGMIRTPPVKLQSSFFDTKLDMIHEITLQIDGEQSIIQHSQTLRYGGLLDRNTSHAFAALSRAFPITFKVSIDQETSTSKKNKSNDCRSLKVILYGVRQDSDGVGALLLENKLYLQQPILSDPLAPYFNPQYLIRPGSEFKPVVQEDSSPASRFQRMVQVEKHQILSVFDSAVGPTTFSEVEVTRRLSTDLKSYQRKALAMMLEKESGRIENTEFPSMWIPKVVQGGSTRYWNSVTRRSQYQPPPLCLGGLLADEMGLGKTLTMLSLIAGSIDGFDKSTVPDKHFRDSSSVGRGSNTTLIVTPLSTLSTWEEQIEKHFRPGTMKFLLYHGTEREQEVSNILQYDIIITTYDTLKAECPTISKNKSQRTGLLHSIDWCRVVLDEAHVIRNRSSQAFHAVNTLHATHRWCLTGTPIQNRVEDLGALVGFLRVYPFDDPTHFRTHFVNSTQKENSTGIEKIKALIQAIALRRTKDTVCKELELRPRLNRVESVELSTGERTLYDIVKRSWNFATNHSRAIPNILQTITKLRQICNHGRELLSSETVIALDQAMINGRFEPIFKDTISCDNCGVEVQDFQLAGIADTLPLCLHLLCNKCLTKTQEDNTEELICPVCAQSGISDSVLEDDSNANPVQRSPQHAINIDNSYQPSTKILALLQNLRAERLQSTKEPIKSVVFSSWTKMLDLAEKALAAEGIFFQRIDGGKSLRQRRLAIEIFRSNPSCTVLLASVGSAGVGLDLTVASRVHLLEPQWNPMAEEQALDRVHRLGQTQEVVAIRYIVKDSIEEYILQIQRTKLDLIQASFDDRSRSRADVIRDRLKNLQAALE